MELKTESITQNTKDLNDIISKRDFDPDVERTDLPEFPEQFEEHDGMYMSTYSGFSPDECTSALQKAIRRGWFRDAFQNGLELYRSGSKLRTNVFNRLIIISFEDVGIADPFAALDVYHLFKKRGTQEEELAMITAIFRLCQAKKCRINDNSVYMYQEPGKDEKGIKWKFQGSIDTWQDSFLEALKNKEIGYAHYYRQAIATSDEKVKIDGKGRDGAKLRPKGNAQALIWDSFDKLMPQNEYLKIIKEIAMLPNHKWKPGTQMYQTHCINLICLGIVPSNQQVEGHKAMEPLKELQLYLDEHKQRTNMKGIADYALDKHTRKGKAKGRGLMHFFAEGAKLHDEDPRFHKLSEEFYEDLEDNLKAAGKWH